MLYLNYFESLLNNFILLTSIKSQGKVALFEDFYWKIQFDCIYNTQEKPEFVIGSLVDDWMWLEKIITEENPLIRIDMDRLGNIVTAIAYVLNTPPQEPLEKAIVFVDVAILKNICDLIFTKARTANISTVAIPHAHYWTIEITSMYDIINDPNITLADYEQQIKSLPKQTSGPIHLSFQDCNIIGNLLKMLETAIDPRSPEGITFWFAS